MMIAETSIRPEGSSNRKAWRSEKEVGTTGCVKVLRPAQRRMFTFIKILDIDTENEAEIQAR